MLGEIRRNNYAHGCNMDDHTRVLPNSEDADNYELLSTALAPHYQLYLNLSDRQYGGQM